MTWSLDPKTFNLVHVEGKRNFTAAEFAEQQWPPCPVCSTTIRVRSIHTPSLQTRDSYLVGKWVCPRGCEPGWTAMDRP